MDDSFRKFSKVRQLSVVANTISEFCLISNVVSVHLRELVQRPRASQSVPKRPRASPLERPPGASQSVRRQGYFCVVQKRSLVAPKKGHWCPPQKVIGGPPKRSLVAPQKSYWWPPKKSSLVVDKNSHWWPPKRSLLALKKVIGWPPKKSLVAPKKVIGGPQKDHWWPQKKVMGGPQKIASDETKDKQK